MNDDKELCITCAYRATCQKQFSLKAGRHCPEYARDLTIKKASQESDTSAGKDRAN